MSRKGHYPGGSTLIYGPRPVSIKTPKGLAALDAWIAGAASEDIKLPKDIKLKPIQRFNKKASVKKQVKTRRKKPHAGRKISTAVVRFNKPDADFRPKIFAKFVEQMKNHDHSEVAAVILEVKDGKTNRI